jgi:hypothetical protein
MRIFAASWIDQLDTPLNDTRDTADEEVTVSDPGHPLYGRRFRVAARAHMPGSQGSHVLVFYRDGIQLRIPTAAIESPKTGQAPRTRVTGAAVEELLSTARACGICPSSHADSGDPSPKS